MEPIYTLKFSFNRSLLLATFLFHAQELFILGIVMAAEYSGFYSTLFQLFTLQQWLTYYFFQGMLCLNILITLSLFLTLVAKIRCLNFIIPSLSIIIKLFPYVLSTPLFNLCFLAIFNSPQSIVRLAAILNLPFFLGYLILQEFINSSLKFIQIDLCNRRSGSITQTLLAPTALLVLQILGPFYGCLVCSLRMGYELYTIWTNCEYNLPQRLKIFYALFTFYYTFLFFLANFNIVISRSTFSTPHITLVILIAGYLAAWVLSRQMVNRLWKKMLSLSGGSVQQSGDKESYDSEELPVIRIENQIKILVKAFIERGKYLNHEDNLYCHFWRQFNQIVFLHKIKCQLPKCICRGKKHMTDIEIETEIFVEHLLKIISTAAEMLGKETRLKVVITYLLIQIAKKPLKGYYQLITLKKEKTNIKLKLQIDDLVSVCRECFDQIFYKNKVQNQQLNLLKVIRSEETIKELEDQLKQTITTTSAFLDIFTYSTLKMGQVQAEADRITKMKKSIENKLETLVVDCYDNASVAFSIFVFYRYLEPYRSRQVEFKKAAGQLALKKRLLLKAEGDNISSDHGIIYIDLVEERGKIKKITRNICDFFGYAREDMVGFNINLFMPTIFGKNHAKFLSNFIDKGRIKLLKQKDRMIFAKNKKKFIFPINVRLKAEHLLDNEFGASGLISSIDTSSEFMMIGKNGRIEEMTENLYNRLFRKTLRDDVYKTAKVCAYKLLPGINQIMEQWEQNQASKIYEGLVIFPSKQQYLLEKFRHTREISHSSIGRSKSSSVSVLSSSSSSIPLHSLPQRFQFFSQLFKSFLSDINPLNLKAFKVSYKYSRIKTAEFEVELIEILSMKQNLEGKQYLRQLVNEFNNLAEVYQLLDEQSPLSQHLIKLEDMSEGTARIQDFSKKYKYQESGMNQPRNRQNLMENFSGAEFNGDRIYNQSASFEQDDQPEEKDLANHHASQTGSVTGGTETESKKQLLINAFNTSQDAIPRYAIICAVIAVIVLLTLLGVMTMLQLNSIEQEKKLWKDSSYILKLRLIFEYRLALAEITRFAVNMNLTYSATLISKSQLLNQEMVILAKSLVTNTHNTQIVNSPFTFSTPIHDPNKQITYISSFPSSVNHLTQLFTEETLSNNDTLRYNYEGLHVNFTDFFNMRNDYYTQQSSRQRNLMIAFLSIYEVLIGLVALSSIPVYVYFKREEIAVRAKLAYMNQRQIKKAMARLAIVLDNFREVISKASIHKLQLDIIDRQKYDKDEEFSGSKMIKISSESEQYKVFSNPWMYALLVLFIVFFSNLAISLFTIFHTSDTFFIGALQAHKLASDLQIKPPLLVNVYLSNLNRAMENATLKTYTASTINETQAEYFELINTLSKPQYNSNQIAETLNSKSTTKICTIITCSAITNQSLQDVAQDYKHKFDYWNAANAIVPSKSSADYWAAENLVESLFDKSAQILVLSLVSQDMVDQLFASQAKWSWTIVVILSALLLPINLVGLILILRKYLMEVNKMVRSAEQLFMQFPVQVLVENTYLTSYFNAKIKAGK